MRFRSISLCIAMLSSMGGAQACSCAGGRTAEFLHASTGKDGIASIYLPANARGVVFRSAPTLAYAGLDKNDNQLLARLPAALTASEFEVTDIGTGKELAAALSVLSTGQIIALLEQPRYVLRKRDVSAQVRKAEGLFRVAPEGGFLAGHSYRIRHRMSDMAVKVRLGPAVPALQAQAFALRADGPPLRRLLEVPEGGSCSGKVGAAVQMLSIGVPPAYAPYRDTVSFFVLQNGASGFKATGYTSNFCASRPFGGGNLGALKELAYHSCSLAPAPRKAKALVGMLEVDDQLLETEVIEIPFDKATGPACSSFKQPVLRDFN